jgi:hypothetical protein
MVQKRAAPLMRGQHRFHLLTERVVPSTGGVEIGLALGPGRPVKCPEEDLPFATGPLLLELIIHGRHPYMRKRAIMLARHFFRSAR